MRSNEWNQRVCRIAGGLAVAVGLLSSGCVSPWWNAFLSPHEVGNFRDNRVNEIQRAISFRDKPMGISGAVDPVPDDLVATVEEYLVGAGDSLSVRLLDFLQLGMESELNLLIDELGYIDVPQLGWLYVEGMTARQIQGMLVEQSKGVGIYPADASPTVVVQVMSRQQRQFNVSGSILNPGPYVIPRPDFRLREAINQAGGLDQSVKMIYVFRNAPRQTDVKAARGASAGPAAPESAPVERMEPADGDGPPVMPVSMAELSGGSSGGSAQVAPTLPAPADEIERDLLEAVSPGSARPESMDEPEASAEVEPTAPAASPGPGGGLPTYIYVNGKFVEAPATGPVEPATQDVPWILPTTPEASAEAAAPAEEVDWEALASEGQQRVLRIPADKLKQGDPNYNIVIRHQDWIELDPGAVGVFYVMGHVLRPGVYSLTGQEITLTQAIAAAGGLDQIAWPSRCEIRRRLDGDREEITQWDLARIMAGQDPDLYLKKEDVVNVGTHAVAPLLATIRNSFRLTYGFGFVYDRNFADIDAVSPKFNPEDVRRNQRAQLGLLN